VPGLARNLRRDRRRPAERGVAGLLVLALLLLAAGVELHPAEADPLSEVASALGGEIRVDTSSHPERPTDCLEQESDVRTRPCPGCLSGLHHHGLDVDSGVCGQTTDVAGTLVPAHGPDLPAPHSRAATSRGPPLLG